MKRISKLFLFSALLLILLTSACGANGNATPTLSGTSIVETSTPFMGLGTPTVGTPGTATTGTVTTVATTGSETPTLSGAQSVSTQVTSAVGSPVAGATQTQSAAIPVTGSEITLVDCQFCVDNLAHALLVLPDVSTFQIVSPTTSTSTTNTTTVTNCSTIEVNNGKQVVLCSGPASTPVVLNICTNGSCKNFPVNLQACPLAQPQPAATQAPGKTQPTPTPGTGGGTASPTATTAASTPTAVSITDTPTP